MEKDINYKVESVIGRMAESIDALVKEKNITDKSKLYIYGVDKFSFAIRTLLNKRGYVVTAYICPDSAERSRIIRAQKDFISQYLNSERDVIPVKEISVVNDTEGIILTASNHYEKIIETLDTAGLHEGKDYYCLYDGVDEEFEKNVNESKRIGISELKRSEVRILQEIDNFCIKNHLRYWVCGGSLLGTIRHKGFIPWDDDIDIFLPWRDYVSFLESFSNGDRYTILKRNPKKPERYVNYFAKVIDKKSIVRTDLMTYRKIEGIWVDVFPLIGLPDEKKERDGLFYSFQEYEKSMWESYYKNDGSFREFPKWFEKQEDLFGMYAYDSSTLVGTPGSYHMEKDLAKRECYEKTIRMPFEDIEVSVPAGYHEYLCNLFGDRYMELPPESARVSWHNIECYWMED